MYTQCPECDVAFRVTADVLKQAAGKVRCGGCGIAFNALAHLSEDMPAVLAEERPPVAAEPIASDESPELEAGTPPQAISAEQSAALLKTLDQLAGEDIRIEDTGVEWRVMDDDEDVDKELADDPVPSAVHEEMRFDDNTPLPEDFDLDAPAPPPAIEPESEPGPEPEPDLESSQVDLVFGEAGEWEDLLGDLDEAAQPLDVDTQFALQAEEMGLDLGAEQDASNEDEVPVELDEQADEESVIEIEEALEVELEEETEDETEDVGETSIEEDLIAAAFEVEAAARQEEAQEEAEELDEDEEEEEEEEEEEKEEEAANEEINLDDVDPEDLTRAGILDEDDYLEDITADDEDEILDEIQLEDSPQDQLLAQEVLDDEVALEAAVEALEEKNLPEEDLEEESDEDEAEEDELDEDLLEEEDLLDEGELEENELEEDEEPEEELDEAEPEAIEFAEPVDVEVPEPTEEEMTVNMMIDQDLLAIAVEDEDGFTSTIVQKQVTSEEEIPPEAEPDDAEDDRDKDDDAAYEEEEIAEDEASTSAEFEATPPAAANDNPLMETIIMEGETYLNEQDEERLAAARAAASESLKKAGFEPEKTSFRDWRPPKYSIGATAALLLVVLVFQVIHYSREGMAVSPAFQNTIGPVYRMVGSPITPAWDVKGWRFEATKGSTNEAGDVLTIYSRIGNNSEQTLPYPLVHVSLTDRFEEIIGSRVLEPADYLVDDTDPSVSIKPRETFNAVIAIESPSAAATSFKLNVCYRLASGQLRCADKDFR